MSNVPVSQRPNLVSGDQIVDIRSVGEEKELPTWFVLPKRGGRLGVCTSVGEKDERGSQ